MTTRPPPLMYVKIRHSAKWGRKDIHKFMINSIVEFNKILAPHWVEKQKKKKNGERLILILPNILVIGWLRLIFLCVTFLGQV